MSNCVILYQNAPDELFDREEMGLEAEEEGLLSTRSSRTDRAEEPEGEQASPLRGLESHILWQRFTLETSLYQLMFLIGLIAIVTGFAAFGGYELAMIPGSVSIALGTLTLSAAARRSPRLTNLAMVGNFCGVPVVLVAGLVLNSIAWDMSGTAVTSNSSNPIQVAWYGNNATVARCTSAPASTAGSAIVQTCSCQCPMFASIDHGTTMSTQVAGMRCLPELYRYACTGQIERAQLGVATNLFASLLTFLGFIVAGALSCAQAGTIHPVGTGEEEAGGFGGKPRYSVEFVRVASGHTQ